MPIEYRMGNLLETDVKHIGHGCNARGVMGSGVAAAIRSKYPKAYKDYAIVHNNGGLDLGRSYSSEQPDGKVVHNMITQMNFGSDPNTVYVSYWAIANCFRELDGAVHELAIPAVGAGLANGAWRTIHDIIENTAKETNVIVYILESEWDDFFETDS